MSTSNDTLQLAKDALAAPADGLTDALRKAAGISTATGLVAYDLEAPAKSLYPVLTPMRNLIPRVGGGVGTATHWKGITGINTQNLSVGLEEGKRGGVNTVTEVDYVASYAGLGFEDFATFEADYAGRTFQDVKALAALNALRGLMLAEESIIGFGNASNALGTTPTATVSTATTGGSIAATTAYSVIAVALTPAGYRRSSVSGGLPTAAVSRSNADGTTTSFNPGVAAPSASAPITTGSGSTNTISASVTPVPGAAAYAWYCGVAGSEKLSQITTINSVLITTIPTTTQAASALSATDISKDALVFDGLLTFAVKSGSGAYVQAVATGTPGTGSGLTSDGAGGIAEINAMFQSMWDNYKLGPKRLWVSSQESINISKKVIGNGGAPLYRITQDATGTHSVTGGVKVTGLLNPVTQEMVDIVIHPTIPKGTILADSDEIPYPMSNVGNVRQIRTRQEYYQIEWPVVTRQYPYGVYVDEVLQHFFTPALGVIYNLANI